MFAVLDCTHTHTYTNESSHVFCLQRQCLLVVNGIIHKKKLGFFYDCAFWNSPLGKNGWRFVNRFILHLVIFYWAIVQSCAKEIFKLSASRHLWFTFVKDTIFSSSIACSSYILSSNLQDSLKKYMFNGFYLKGF